MKDPLADKALLQRLTHDEDTALHINYRRDKGFRWPHLEYFKKSVWSDDLVGKHQDTEEDNR